MTRAVIVALSVGLVIASAFALWPAFGDAPWESDTRVVLVERPPIASSPSPVPASPTSQPTARPATPAPDRTNCDLMRGTPYRSETEREWFLVNCVAEGSTGSGGAVDPGGSGSVSNLPPAPWNYLTCYTSITTTSMSAPSVTCEADTGSISYTCYTSVVTTSLSPTSVTCESNDGSDSFTCSLAPTVGPPTTVNCHR
jgi:hypothetical protein